MIARIENNVGTGQVRYFDPSGAQIDKATAEAEIFANQQAAANALQDPAHITQRMWDQVRTQRNGLLSDSDWTQLSDSPVDSSAWAIYRQELRDIPQTFSTPESVVWPAKP